jgi:hypothetical protein
MMKTDDRMAVWGCTICANVWAASSNQPLGFVWCAIWICFGAAIIVPMSRARDQVAEGCHAGTARLDGRVKPL